MSHRAVALLALLVFGSALGGCISSENESDDEKDAMRGLVPVRERHLQPYDVAFKPLDHGGHWSKTLKVGEHDILAGFGVDIPVDMPATEGGNAATGDATVHVGIFLPSIDGCDWDAADLPAHCQVPVIGDAGPYYSSSKGEAQLQTEGDNVTELPADRLGKWLISNFVPHGYAVAHISVFGTGDSGHCMDLMGPAEQAGVVAAVEWLGSQPWSNGAVALTGRSYDGTTPWEAAMHAPEVLKTIVPISGLIGQHDLMWRNGSAEFRAPGVLYGLYAAMTIDGEPGDAQQVLCPDYLTGAPQGVGAYLTGDRFVDAANPYWAERRFLDDTLANYKGSIYFIHGMQDWNVDNHMAFPAYQMLKDAGFEIKGLFGQWHHNYPDRIEEHEGCGERCRAPTSVRMDWAQDMLEWFDHYLKGTGPKPEPHVEIQDDAGMWRIEDTYPPLDAAWTKIPFSDMTLETDEPAVIAGAPFLGAGPGQNVVLTLPVFAEETKIAGNIRLPITVTPAGPGGQVYAELQDENGDHLAHAIMDLRYAAGGDEMQPVVPGMPLVAKIEFLAADLVIPAGSELTLLLSVTGEDYLPPSVNDPVAIDTSDASVLKLPVVQRGPEAYFTPPTYARDA